MTRTKQVGFTAFVAAIAVLATTFVAPSPARAVDVANAHGCGTNATVGDFDNALLLYDNTWSINGLKFECVVNVQPLDLGFAVLSFGTAVAARGQMDLRIQKDCTDILCLGFDIYPTVVTGTVDACMGFSGDIRVAGVSPDKASFSCPAIRTHLLNNATDTSRGLFGIGFSSAGFVLAEGGRGSVNGLSPFSGFGGLLSFLNPIIIPLVKSIVPGPLTDDVMVNLKNV